MSSTITCPSNFVYIYHGCYQVTPVGYSWFQAVTVCQQQGAYLATFTSTAQARWVSEYFWSVGYSNNKLWIGLNDIAQSYDFQWIDGSYSDLRMWASYQPDETYGTEHCANMEIYNQGLWSVNPCSNQFNALCKWNEAIGFSRSGTNKLSLHHS